MAFSLYFQARVALYNNDSETEILSLVFNASKSSKLNWFSRNRLTFSPWTDLVTEKPRGFGVRGCCGRNFYITKSHGGCAEDFGWLVVTSNRCAWETRFPSRTVLYSNRTNYTHWNEYGKNTEHKQNHVLLFQTIMKHVYIKTSRLVNNSFKSL